MCRWPNSTTNFAIADGTRSVPATFVGDVINARGTIRKTRFFALFEAAGDLGEFLHPHRREFDQRQPAQQQEMDSEADRKRHDQRFGKAAVLDLHLEHFGLFGV